MAGIELKSAAFNDHAMIPRRYAKDDENISPPLTWSRVPDGTAELVLLCEDPDAPSGTFVHWLVTRIDPAAGGVDTGQTPPGGSARKNGYGEAGWGGPHPPAGDDAHRYFFRLYALPEPVTLPDNATADDVHRAVDEGQLASGTIVGMFQR
ncbi:YbhB/YbcL family Raf kinase inhibitor-like protein [Streptomyces sp. NBC_01410]|uniref:YbhB/YbcL family Raf kinase inhibitor-like protein n=1 Tax=Streptomyces sp. NBC_01410 TaxID=2903856 RepID=UPI0032461400